MLKDTASCQGTEGSTSLTQSRNSEQSSKITNTSQATGIEAFLERMKATLKLELIRKSQKYEFDFEGGRPLNQA